MTARIAPAAGPFPPDVEAALAAVMRGRPPLVLFTTLLRDLRLARKFFAGSLLDRGHLALRERELVILRTTARCGSEYEWGVHVAAFGARAGLDEAQCRSLVHGGAADACWSEDDRDLVALADAMHQQCDVEEPLWQRLRRRFGEEAMLELLLLGGFYRTVSLLTNALRLPLEADAARFPAAEAHPS